jgi:hypothetical protein
LENLKLFLFKNFKSNFGKNDETGFPRTLRNEAQNIESLFDHEASKYPGMLKNNFVNSASFKVASVWNCDWKFNRLPDMHIKFALLFVWKNRFCFLIISKYFDLKGVIGNFCQCSQVELMKTPISKSQLQLVFLVCRSSKGK